MGFLRYPLLSGVNFDLAVSKAFYFFFFGAFGSLFPLLGVYFKQLGMTPTQTGLIVGFRPFIEFVSAPWWGGIADRFRKGKQLLMVSLTCWIAFTLAMGFVQTPPVGCVKYNGTDFLMVEPWFDTDAEFPNEPMGVTAVNKVVLNPWERQPMEMGDFDAGERRRRDTEANDINDIERENHLPETEKWEREKKQGETPDVYTFKNDTRYNAEYHNLTKEDIPIGKVVPDLINRVMSKYAGKNASVVLVVEDGPTTQPSVNFHREQRGGGGGNYIFIPRKYRKKTTPKPPATEPNKFRPHQHFEGSLPPPDVDVIGLSPVPLDWRDIANVNENEAEGMVSPLWSTIVYRTQDVYEIFLILLLLVLIGEFFSAPAINLADAATLGYLGDDIDQYGRQRLFGSLGWALAMFIVGIALDHSNMFPNHPCGNTRAGEKNYTVCFAVFTVMMILALLTATQFRFEYDGVKEDIPLGDIRDIVSKVKENIGKRRKYDREKLVDDDDDDWEHVTPGSKNRSENGGVGASGVPPNDIKITLQTDAGMTTNVPSNQAPPKVLNTPYVPRGTAGQSGTMPGWMTVLRHLGNPHYGAVLFLTWFVGFGVGLNFTFLFWHLQDIGGGPTLFGISSVINHVCEIFAFVICKRLIMALGHVKVLYLGLLANILRFLIISWLRNPWWVIPFEFLQGLTHATVWAAICSYVTQAIPYELHSSAQTILQVIHHGLGRGCGALIGGCLASAYGTEMTFRGYGIACVVILILYVALTYAFRGQSPLGEPPEDKHEILEESSHLAPCGVPMSPMSRNLSSERIAEKDAQNGYGTTVAPSVGGYLDPATGRYVPGNPPSQVPDFR